MLRLCVRRACWGLAHRRGNAFCPLLAWALFSSPFLCWQFQCGSWVLHPDITHSVLSLVELLSLPFLSHALQLNKVVSYYLYFVT